MEQVKWLLKVLSGPNIGAEILLQNRTYLLGQNSDCDIVLADKSIAQQHLKIVVSKESIFIYPKQQEIAVNHHIYKPGEEIELEKEAVIALGTTYIVIGDTDTDWAALAWEPFNFDLKNEQSDLEIKKSAIAIIPEKNKTTSQNDSKNKNFFISVFVLFFFVLLIYLQINTHLFSLQQPEYPQQKQISPLEQLNNVLKPLKQSGIKWEKISENTFLVSGYTQTNKERRTINRLVKKLPFSVKQKIYSQQQLMINLTITLTNMNYQHIQILYLKQGKVLLAGYIAQMSETKQLFSTLYQEVAGLKEIDNNIVDIIQSVSILKDWVKKEGLANTLNISLSTGKQQKINIGGHLSAEQANHWELIKQRFIQKYGRLPVLSESFNNKLIKPKTNPLETTNLDTASDEAEYEKLIFAAPDGKIKITGALIGDGKKYMVLNNGSFFSEGEYFNTDFYVLKVQWDRILISNGRQNFVYHVGNKRIILVKQIRITDDE